MEEEQKVQEEEKKYKDRSIHDGYLYPIPSRFPIAITDRLGVV
jgi:hypothetical protein